MRYPKPLALLLLVAMTGPANAAPPSALPDKPEFSTVAGSGRLGLADGLAASSEFVRPLGLAYAPDGSLIVADAGAQRIRRFAGGSVTTIAGSGELHADGAVDGDFRDGSIAQARFHEPSAVAVDGDGAIYVADTRNHCIRLIVREIVSTLAGRCGQPGSQDGESRTARFASPRSLALSGGDLFVADPPNGVRRISAKLVTTIHVPAPVSAVASWNGRSRRLFAGGVWGVSILDPVTGRLIKTVNSDESVVSAPSRDGSEVLGPISSMAAIGERKLLITDPLMHAVRFLDIGDGAYVRTLSSDAISLSGNRGGGFRDGPGGQAMLDAPMGVAAQQGKMVVADTGNKRLRGLAPFDTRTYYDESPVPNTHAYSVALVGNSFIWTNTSWNESIPGRMQAMLSSTPSKGVGAREVSVVPYRKLGITMRGAQEFVHEYLRELHFGVVVLDVNSYMLKLSYGDAADWPSRFRADATSMRTDLERAGGKLLIVLQPFGRELSPLENAYRDFPGIHNEFADQAGFADSAGTLRRLLGEAGIAFADLYPALRRELFAPAHAPLYGTWDHHFTAHGCEVAAGAIVQALEGFDPRG